jgi:hypothetical protein
MTPEQESFFYRDISSIPLDYHRLDDDDESPLFKWNEEDSEE